MATGLGYTFEEDPENPFALQKSAQAGAGTTGYENVFSAENAWAQPAATDNPAAPASGGDAAAGSLASAQDTAQTDWTRSSYETPPAATPPATSGGTAGPGPTSAPTTPGPNVYKDSLTKLQQTTDPQQKAVLKDQLARTVFSSLKTAGHDVSWDGDQLMIDGRAYVVGGDGGNTGVAGGTTPTPTTAPTGWGQYVGAGQNAALDPTKMAQPDADLSPKYAIARVLSFFDPRQGFTPDVLAALNALNIGTFVNDNDRLRVTGTVDPRFEGTLASDMIRNAGAPEARWGGWGSVTDSSGGGTAGAGPIPVTPGTAGAAGVAVNTSAAPPGPDPFAAQGGGVLVNGGWVPKDHPQAQSSAASGFQPTAPTYTPGEIPTDDLEGFSYADTLAQTGPGYEAPALATDPLAAYNFEGFGDLGDVAPGYDAPALSADPLATYSFEDFGDLGQFGGGPTDAETEALISSILAHPESLDARTIDMLKAASKDELAQMSESEIQDLQQQGVRLGITDSSWLQSEVNTSKRTRDQGLVKSNRDIELTAAQTNLADKRAAAELGASYASSKAGRNLAERGQRFTEATAGEGLEQAEVASKNAATQYKTEVAQRDIENAFRSSTDQRAARGQRFTEATTGEGLKQDSIASQNAATEYQTRISQQNVENAFRSTADQRAAVALASDTSLRAAALKGDRIALQESLKQKAAELGQSADRVQLDYVLGLLHDATSRYGIEVGASIDRQKLAQAGSEFQQDLIFRIMALQQSDAQFGASYGLDVARETNRSNEAGQASYDQTADVG